MRVHRAVAGGRERGRPARRGAVSRDQGFSGEHRVGLFADRTRHARSSDARSPSYHQRWAQTIEAPTCEHDVPAIRKQRYGSSLADTGPSACNNSNLFCGFHRADDTRSSVLRGKGRDLWTLS